MNTRFPRIPGAKDNNPPVAVRPADDIITGRESDEIIGRACCCPASPVVRVILPPTRQRPHDTELLLCGHHLRSSRQALAACHAIIFELPHVPEDLAAAFCGEIEG